MFENLKYRSTTGNVGSSDATVASARILIADDHPLYLDAVRERLVRTFEDVQVRSATTLAMAFDLLEEEPVELVLLDYVMPGCNSIQAVRDMTEAANGAPVMAMSGLVDESIVAACLRAGARGFLPKTLEGEAFIAAVSLVAAGGFYVPPGVGLPWEPSAQPGRAAQDTDHEAFTDREIAFLAAVVDGRSNKEIARDHDLQEVTVKYYLTRIFRKLRVRNRSQAAVIAVRSGLIQ